MSIYVVRNKIEDLSCQNAELSVKYENTVDKGEQLTKQLESKMQEVKCNNFFSYFKKYTKKLTLFFK